MGRFYYFIFFSLPGKWVCCSVYAQVKKETQRTGVFFFFMEIRCTIKFAYKTDLTVGAYTIITLENKGKKSKDYISGR